LAPIRAPRPDAAEETVSGLKCTTVSIPATDDIVAPAPAQCNHRRALQKGRRMSLFAPLDLAALGFFIFAWAVYAIALERTRFGANGLNTRMDRYREVWIRRALAREMRMVDMQIMAALQSGTAFFASTALIAIGGALSFLRSTDQIVALVSHLPFEIAVTAEQWEFKTIGLVLMLVYAFFKFSWSYRLFNYVSILLGGLPPVAEKDTPAAEAHVIRTSRVFRSAGRHFNHGQRALFFALAYLGWFIHPWTLIASTAAVLVVMMTRQFASEPQRALED
jgi:uncharacterized membrane protein